MERYRTIKYEYWRDPDMSQLDAQTNLCLISLWNFTDDNGVIPGRASWIRETIFSCWKIMSARTINKCLKNLIAVNKIIPFTYRGQSFFFIVNFKQDQKVEKKWAKFYIEPEKVEPVIARELESRNLKNPVQKRVLEHSDETSETEGKKSKEKNEYRHGFSKPYTADMVSNMGKNIDMERGSMHPPNTLYFILQIQEITNRHLGRDITVEEAEKLSLVINDLSVWEETMKYWVEKGYNPENLDAMTDRYRRIVKGILSSDPSANEYGHIPQVMFTDEELRRMDL